VRSWNTWSRAHGSVSGPHCLPVPFAVEADCFPLTATRDQFGKFLDALGQLESETPHLSMVKAAPKSVDWVAKDASFVEWRQQPEVRMLHVSGPPGSGVTVLASHMVKLALEERGYRDATVLRFVFERHSVQARNPECALVSLCRQLLLARPWLFRLVRPLCDFMLEQGLFTRKVLWALLRSLLQHAAGGTTYCVLFAVHECEEPMDDLLAGLGGLGLKTMVTSDDGYASQTHAWRDASSSRSMRRGAGHGAMDVQALARANVGRIARDKPLWAELQQDIVNALCAAPASHLAAMHRLVLLQWGDGRSTRAAMRKRLADVSRPGGHLVREHVRDNWVRWAFRWVAHAVRPLTTAELAVAVALEELGIRSAEEGLTASQRQRMLLEHVSRDIVGDLLRTAPPLVELVGNRVVPIHRRLRASLCVGDDDDNNPPSRFSDPHYAILTACLEYLKWTDAAPGDPRRHHHPQTADDADSAVLQGALVGYASAYWPEHYRRIKRSKSHAATTVRRFLSDRDNLDRWAGLYCERKHPPPDEPGLLRSPTEAICHLGYLHMLKVPALQTLDAGELRLALDHAVRGGQAKVVARLLEVGARSERAVRLAAARGHDRLIKALLNIDTGDLARAGEGGYTALHHAACRGHDTSVELLLGRDAGLLDACTVDGSSALCLAAKSGQASVVTTLVRLGADWAIEDTSGYDALHMAARGGFSDIVDILLPLGADPHKKGGPDGNTAVHLAVRFDHPITLRKLLRSPRDTELRNSRSYTPLHVAAQEGFLPIIQALVDAAAKPPAAEEPVGPDEGGDEEGHSSTPLIMAPTDLATPLQLAATRGHIEAVRMLLAHRAYHDDKADRTRALFVATAEGFDEVVGELLAHGASLDVEDTAGNTLLHEAVEGGNVKVLLEMLGREKAKLDMPNHASATPLHLAAEMGTLAMVYNLLDHGANPSPRTRAQETPLHLAARGGHRLVARKLQQHMDTIDHKDKAGHTAFGLAVQGGHVAIVKDLLKARSGDEFRFPFHTRAILEQEVVLRALLESGEWDCNTTSDEHPQTPLQVAVDLDLLAAVELLLNSGADVHAKDAQGITFQTPLYMAAQRGASKIVDLLLKHGADIRKADRHGDTPLFAATRAGHVDTVRRLLANDPPPDVVNRANLRGWTALYAAATQEAAIAQMLLKAGASPHSRTYEAGTTPLARAAFDDSRIEVVRHLLDFGAEPDEPDKEGETAVHRAAIGGSVEIMKLFISAKANLNAQRPDGCTPLQLAILFREPQVAELLLDQASVRTNTRSEENGTVLMSAVLAGFTVIVQRLLERDGDDSQVGEGEVLQDVLVAAVKKGDELMVKSLLDRGAQVRVPGVPDSNVLFTALRSSGSKGLSIVKHLLDADADAMNDVDFKHDSVLRVAVARKLVDVVEYLVEKDASTVREPPGKEPLALSVARWGPWETLAALLKRSAHLLSVQDRFGRSPLAAAIYARNITVAVNLLRYDGVNVNDKDHAGRTPLISSVLKLGTLVRALLGEAAIDINSQDAEGKTALAHACFVNDKASVALLLGAGASTTLLDVRGRGPLYWACRTASTDVFEQVLQALHEESPSSYVYQREAALCAAIASNKPTFLEILLGPGDDIASPLPPNDGWTAMYTAQLYKLAWAERRLSNTCFAADEKPLVLVPSAWSVYDKTVNLEVDADTRWVTALGKSMLGS